jgi:hypothetical protein
LFRPPDPSLLRIRYEDISLRIRGSGHELTRIALVVLLGVAIVMMWTAATVRGGLETLSLQQFAVGSSPSVWLVGPDARWGCRDYEPRISVA